MEPQVTISLQDFLKMRDRLSTFEKLFKREDADKDTDFAGMNVTMDEEVFLSLYPRNTRGVGPGRISKFKITRKSLE